MPAETVGRSSCGGPPRRVWKNGPTSDNNFPPSKFSHLKFVFFISCYLYVFLYVYIYIFGLHFIYKIYIYI